MNPFSPSAPRPHNLTLFLLAALLAPAASVEFLTPSDPPALTVGPAEVQSSLLQSLTCAGYTTNLQIPSISVGGPPVPPRLHLTRFLGANPRCLVSGELPLPGLRNDYGATPVESVPRYRRALLRELWPGVDLAVEHRDGRFRLSFLLESAAHAGLVRLQPDSPESLLRFSYFQIATLRAEELTPYGPQPIPVERLAAEAPFRIPAPTPHPVRIILEVPADENEPGPYFSRRDESGDRYELNGRSIRRLSPAGEVRYETRLPGLFPNALLPAGDLLLVTGRGTPGATVAVLDRSSGRLRFTRLLQPGWPAEALGPAVDRRGRLHVFVALRSRLEPFGGADCPHYGQFLSFVDRCRHITLTPAGDILDAADAPLSPVLTPDGELLSGAVGLSPTDSVVSAVADRDGGVWVSVSDWQGRRDRLLHRPPGARRPYDVPGVDVSGVLTVDGDELFLAAYADASAVPASPDAVFSAPCPEGSSMLLRLSPDGVVRYSTYLPDGLDAYPGRDHAPRRAGALIDWARHTLNPAAPAPPAYACFGYRTFLPWASPGPFLILPVRGVEDASPWTSPAPYPTDLRGWSIRFDGRPAGIVSLTRDAVTVLPPPGLSRAVEVETTYRGRRTAGYSLYF
jgi:hypothetical protein